MMQTFTYSFIFRMIFRYGNIVVTIFLLLYCVPLVMNIDTNKILILPIALSLLLIYIINRSYLTYYIILAYKIEADDEKILCSDFLLSNKVITIYYADIENLKGGVFERKSSGIMKVYDGKNNVTIGFSQKMKDSQKLITLILSKVKREIYDEVIEQLTDKRNIKNSAKQD
ncbi:MAG: hypothetical protein P8X73_10200 [Ignavibacteriaceae bacterium]